MYEGIPIFFSLQIESQQFLFNKIDNLSEAFDIITSFSDDFMEDERNDTPPQERDFDA